MPSLSLLMSDKPCSKFMCNYERASRKRERERERAKKKGSEMRERQKLKKGRERVSEKERESCVVNLVHVCSYAFPITFRDKDGH